MQQADADLTRLEVKHKTETRFFFKVGGGSNNCRCLCIIYNHRLGSKRGNENHSSVKDTSLQVKVPQLLQPSILTDFLTSNKCFMRSQHCPEHLQRVRHKTFGSHDVRMLRPSSTFFWRFLPRPALHRKYLSFR